MVENDIPPTANLADREETLAETFDNYSAISVEFESIWVSSPERSMSQSLLMKSEGTNDEIEDDFAENGGRFVVPPAKYSQPIAVDKECLPSDLLRVQSSTRDPIGNGKGEEYSNFHLYNNEGQQIIDDDQNNNFESISDRNKMIKDDDSLFIFAERDQLKKSRLVKTTNDDLSKKSKGSHRVHRRSRQRRKQPQQQPITQFESSITDDDTSTENYGANPTIYSTSLQARTKKAWKSRQRKNSNFRSAKKAGEISNKNIASIRSPSHNKGTNNVSFGPSNTIHRFETKEEGEKEELMSYDNRSLNSEYTKSLESEVEDMIKDIFFIGTQGTSRPGRRKYRYKPEVKRKILNGSTEEAMESLQIDKKDPHSDPVLRRKEKLVESCIDEDENDTALEPNPSNFLSSMKEKQERFSMEKDKPPRASSKIAPSSNSSLDDTYTFDSTQLNDDPIEDPFNNLLGFIEGGLSAVTSAIGYAVGDSPSQREHESSMNELKPKPANDKLANNNEYDIFESCGINIGSPTVINKSNLREGYRVDILSKRDHLLRSNIPQPLSSNKIHASKVNETYFATTHERYIEGSASNEMNGDLKKRFKADIYQLAIHAAYSVHKLQGFEYNNSIAIDLNKEVKISKVNLELPLGIIFLENDGGCFVTKKAKNGSAAKSLGVEVGDQLASINGVTSVRMKVDDICDAISDSSDSNKIELVFLRYIGPFRPIKKNSHLKRDNNLLVDGDDTFRKSECKVNATKKRGSGKTKSVFSFFGKGKNK